MKKTITLLLLLLSLQTFAQCWQSISAGDYHSLAIKNDGTLWAWGRNTSYEIGDGTYVQKNVYTYISCYPSVLSHENFVINELKIYPNPIIDVLNFSFEKEITTVSIYNLLGQEIITKTVNSNETSINFAGLTAGTYLVKITSGNEIKTVKVIKN